MSEEIVKSSGSIARAHRTIEAVEKAIGHKLNIVVVEGGEGVPQISMVRPYARGWFTQEQVEEWNKTHRRPAPKSAIDLAPMDSFVNPNPKVYDAETGERIADPSVPIGAKMLPPHASEPRDESRQNTSS